MCLFLRCNAKIISIPSGSTYWMLEQIEAKNLRSESLNWIAPLKAITIHRCAQSLYSITVQNLQNGCKKVLIDSSDLDMEMLRYDGL